MRRAKIDWADLDLACQFDDPERKSFLDLETGDVITVDDQFRNEFEELLEEATDDASFEQSLAAVALPDWQKQALRDAWRVERDFGGSVISLADLDPRETARDRDAFIATMRDPAVRTQLEQASRGAGSWRRFGHVLDGFYRERKQWFVFQDECRRRHAAEWFAAHNIEVEWILPPPPAEDRESPPPRTYLLEGVCGSPAAPRNFRASRESRCLVH